MKDLNLHTNPAVDQVFKNYPVHVRKQMASLRKLVKKAAQELPDVTDLEETLKWGEPSYLSKKGSTVRMDWKEKKPDQYALYFKCTSKLVETFKHVYGDFFNYEGTRAIIFKLNDELPEKELKKCIQAALRYHKVKNLPTLDL